MGIGDQSTTTSTQADQSNSTTGLGFGEVLGFVQGTFGALDVLDDDEDTKVDAEVESARLGELRAALLTQPEAGAGLLSVHDLDETFLRQCLRTYSYDVPLSVQT